MSSTGATEHCPGCGGHRQSRLPLCTRCHKSGVDLEQARANPAPPKPPSLTQHQAPGPTPQNLNWPRLIATAERHGIPVARVDHLGRLQIIRTAHDLDHWKWQ